MTPPTPLATQSSFRLGPGRHRVLAPGDIPARIAATCRAADLPVPRNQAEAVQFLSEAILLAMLGGAAGVTAGALATAMYDSVSLVQRVRQGRNEWRPVAKDRFSVMTYWVAETRLGLPTAVGLVTAPVRPRSS